MTSRTTETTSDGEVAEQASPGSAPLVRCEDLYRLHGDKGDEMAILRGVNCTIQTGEFVCIMGPSGSGKSSLLHLISGLDEPSAGRVLLAGKDLADTPAAERTLIRRRQIGYVFQFFNLLPNLNVTENIALPLVIEGRSREEQAAAVPPLLERFGIKERAHALPHELSGGEMQRTSIARALAGGQPLLLCDEPTGNLSQKAGQAVMESLREACDRDGRTVLLVTHNPRDAAFADRVHFLVDGVIDDSRILEGPDIQVEDVHAALSALHI
ncbi:MAG: putative ABC transport system ATP-binding protein [Planctomycetota bacterium]|jgi:putative ABC transport system ATP-binding protein